MDTPVRSGSGPAVYLRDIGIVENGTDIVTGYAHVERKPHGLHPGDEACGCIDARRHQSASKRLCRRMKAVVPEDVEVRLEFDQSAMFRGASKVSSTKAVLGALLTGLMVLLFLRDWRSALVVIATIPFVAAGRGGRGSGHPDRPSTS